MKHIATLALATILVAFGDASARVSKERICNVVHNLQHRSEVLYCINTSDAVAYERIEINCFDALTPSIITVMKSGEVIKKHYDILVGDMYSPTLVKNDEGKWVSITEIILGVYEMYVPDVHRKHFCEQQRKYFIL